MLVGVVVSVVAAVAVDCCWYFVVVVVAAAAVKELEKQLTPLIELRMSLKNWRLRMMMMEFEVVVHCPC